MSKRTIFLTPECYKTWLIRPGLLLLYDKVIFYEKDYNEIISMQEASTYDYLVFRNTEMLKKEGFIEIVNYKKVLSVDKRQSIRNEAQNFVSNLSEEEIRALLVHAYQEYIKYLEDKLKFYHLDEPKYKFELRRLEKVKNGLEEINKSRELPERYINVLLRITAKIIAGLIVISKDYTNTLHDTNEYKPFFEKYIGIKDIRKVSFEANNEKSVVRKSIAVILNKPYPTTEIYDEATFYEFLIFRKKFSEVKKLINEMEEMFDDLLATNENSIFEKLKKEIAGISKACDKEFQRLKTIK